MLKMYKEAVAPTWDHATYQESKLAKGQRKPKKPVEAVAEVVTHMVNKCCGKPVSLIAKDHCQCLIWDVGKEPRVL